MTYEDRAAICKEILLNAESYEEKTDMYSRGYRMGMLDAMDLVQVYEEITNPNGENKV